ncbi:MAG: flavin reductase family protein [Phycisphaerae bacterium]|nr:flavin reductase family protein [Phycisphaerae bacterium]
MKNLPTTPDADVRARMGLALGRIPQGLYVLTAAHDGREGGTMVSWVQQLAFRPPMVMLSLQRDCAIIPILLGAKCFALNQVRPDDKLVRRNFRPQVGNEELDLHAVETVQKVTGAPVMTRAQTYLDCRLYRHLGVEADHDLYIGLVEDAAPVTNGEVTVIFRDDGFSY